MTELVTATDLEVQWSERNDAREHLPTLVRRLILAVAAPETLRMPAAEGVGLPGLDGEVTCTAGALPFVPAGRSVWEVGTGRDPQAKAQSDYRKRVDETTREQRDGVVFVFVTSRRWPDAQDWIDRRTADDDGWAGIQVVDAESLAAWLAQCPGVHRWLASEQLGRDPHGVTGLRDWYRTWSERTQPTIPAALLLAGRDDHVAELRTALQAGPTEVVIASGSREESVAFVAASLMTEPPQDAVPGVPQPADSPSADDPSADRQADGRPAGDPAGLEAMLERTLIVEDARAWRRVASHESPLVLVPLFDEPEIGDALRAGHHVVLPGAGRRRDNTLPRLHRASRPRGLDRRRARPRPCGRLRPGGATQPGVAAPAHRPRGMAASAAVGGGHHGEPARSAAAGGCVGRRRRR